MFDIPFTELVRLMKHFGFFAGHFRQKKMFEKFVGFVETFPDHDFLRND